jgi:hypothetical protein
MSEQANFKSAVQKHAEFMKWEIEDAVEDDYAEFSFEIEEGNEVDVSFFLNENRVDISLVGNAGAEEEEDIPDDFSTTLMRRSDDLPYGAWTLAETEEGEFYYRLLWTLDLEYFAAMPSDKLQEMVEAMIDEVAEVNDLWEDEL